MRLRTLSSVSSSTRSRVRLHAGRARRARCGSKSTSKRRTPRRTSSTGPARSDPSRYVLPPAVQSLRSEKRSRSRKKARIGVLGHVQLDEPVAQEEERLLPEERGVRVTRS